MSVATRPSVHCRARLLELSRYLDGEFSAARRRTIERHLDSCACCGTLAARLLKTMAACRAEAKKPPPRELLSRAAARIRSLLAQEGARRGPAARRRRRWPVGR
jgi:anti-sigma factor RsiW